MPLVRIEIIKGKSDEYKKTMLEAVHRSLCETLCIEDWDRFQRIVETERPWFETSPEKTDSFTLIELTIFPGRSREQKARAIERITASLGEELGIAPSDVFVVIYEPPLENWGFAGRQKG